MTSKKVIFTDSNNCPYGLGFSKDNLESENIQIIKSEKIVEE